MCISPVLTPAEVGSNAHNLARGTIGWQDTPSGPELRIGVGPKLSDTPGVPGESPRADLDEGASILHGLGYDAPAIARLRAAGTVA